MCERERENPSFLSHITHVISVPSLPPAREAEGEADGGKEKGNTRYHGVKRERCSFSRKQANSASRQEIRCNDATKGAEMLSHLLPRLPACLLASPPLG